MELKEHPLKTELKKRRIRQNEFAKMLGTSTASVSNWIAGRRKPCVHYMEKIRILFNGKITPTHFHDYYMYARQVTFKGKVTPNDFL